MKLLTFLGIAKYQTTTYVWQNLEHESRYAPAASCHFLNPDSLTVFLTEEAHEKVFPDFRASLPVELEVITAAVPLGANEQELWQIFDQVSSTVQPNEHVAFDITHGLRSFPLIGLLAAAFLRAGLNVNIEAVLYGAFDVGRIVAQGRTPMFDLSPMLSLLEWASAADRFNRTGDARYLASLVTQRRKEMAAAAGGDPNLLQEVGYLGNLAGAFTSISESLRLIRPQLAMQQINGLQERTAKARPVLRRTAMTRPFDMLLDNLLNNYLPLGIKNPYQSDTIRETLVTERKMIHWYAEREQWVQAVSLAREWLVSWLMFQLNKFNITQLSVRRMVEQVLGSESNEFKESKKGSVPFTPVFLEKIPNTEDVLALWLSLSDVRNDIDHAGMREEAGEPRSLTKQIENCIQSIDNLPL